MKKIVLENGLTVKYKPKTIKKRAVNENGMIMNPEIELENIKLVISFFEKNNIHYTFYFGSLLGAIRDKNFIVHDEDADIVCFYEQMNCFFENFDQLKSLGFEIIRYDQRFLVSIGRKGEYIDLYFSVLDGEKRVITEMFTYPKHFIENVKKINFLGETINVPENPEEFLLYEYGETWVTPIKWEMNFKQKVVSKIKSMVRVFLSDKLELKLQRKLGQKTKLKFDKKYNDYLNNKKVENSNEKDIVFE